MRLETLVNTKLHQQLRQGSEDLRRVVGHLLVLDMIEISRRASTLAPPAPPSMVKGHSTPIVATTTIDSACADIEPYNVPELDAFSDDDTMSPLYWSSGEDDYDDDDDDDEPALDDEVDFEHALVRVASHSAISVGQGKLKFPEAWNWAQLTSEVMRGSKRTESQMAVTSVVEIVDFND